MERSPSGNWQLLSQSRNLCAFMELEAFYECRSHRDVLFIKIGFNIIFPVFIIANLNASLIGAKPVNGALPFNSLR
jgi:hypothetical protein